MSCQLELDGCPGTTLAMFPVKRFGQKGFVRCCSVCWVQLVGSERSYEAPVKANKPKLPSVPRKGAPAIEALPLYAPPKKSEEPWF